jgi:hypothetical protein
MEDLLMEKKHKRYEKPLLEKFDVVGAGQAGECSSGSVPGGQCEDGTVTTSLCTNGGNKA